EGVVELDPIGGATALAPAGAQRQEDERAEGGANHEHDRQSSHGPSGVSLGSQPVTEENCLRSMEPSPVSRSIEPGHRLFWCSFAVAAKLAARSLGGIRPPGMFGTFPLRVKRFTYSAARLTPPNAS